MSEITKDTWKLGEHEFSSRFILGSGKYSLELIDAAVKEAKAEIVTMALRRANEGGVANILDYIPKNVTLLPNTSGARNAEEAVRIARLSRQISGSDFVKIEVIHDSKYLLPDNYETALAGTFAMHCTFMDPENNLILGSRKGYNYLFDKNRLSNISEGIYNYGKWLKDWN